MKIDKDWHLNNKMPQKANKTAIVKWDIPHQKECICRPIPNKE